jgi:hypothetical protein
VFTDPRDGFGLANHGTAQYPAITRDGGRSWRIDGPQLHIDAADGPEAVSYVGAASARTLYAYGSSVVDVTTDGGRTWWETFPEGLVMAVVPGRGHDLAAYVQQSTAHGQSRTWQYVSSDGGRQWRLDSALGG